MEVPLDTPIVMESLTPAADDLMVQFQLHNQPYVNFELEKSYDVWTWEDMYVCTVNPEQQEEFDKLLVNEFFEHKKKVR